MELLFFFIFTGIAVAIIVMVVKSAEKRRENWKEAARQLKLHHFPGNIFNPGTITGEYHTHKLKITTFSKSSGKNSQTYTKFRITYNKPLKFMFRLTKQNILHSFGQIFGMRDIKVGDKSFDKSVLVQGPDHLAITRFLTAPRRKHIKTALQGLPDVTITNKYIEANIKGTVKSTQIIINYATKLAELADALSRKRNHDHPIKQAKRARYEGNINKAVEILKKADFKENEDKLEAMELKGEMHYIANEKQKAAENFKGLTIEIPDDNQAQEWAQITSESIIDEKSKKVHQKEKEPPPNPPSPETLTKDELCNKLFNSSLGTFDITRIFEKEYQDIDIQWEGTLISAFEFSFDFVFKNSSGVKATFELIELKSEYTTSKIKAIVQFPKEKLSLLKKSKDKQVIFSGKLLSVDALMKNIFITDADII
jgi:hypothetical protein